MCKIFNYFKHRKYEKHLFYLLGFNSKDYTTFKILSVAKKKNAGSWFFNNLTVPLLIILSPYSLTWVHYRFSTLAYHKTFLEILLSGSLTLLGINVIRSASTSIAEKLDKSKIPVELGSQAESVQNEVNSIKNKMERTVWILTFVGLGLYLFQIAQFVNTTNSAIYWVLVGVVTTTSLSIVYGRFLFLLKSNAFEEQEVVSLLFSTILSQTNDYEKLAESLKKGL